MSLLSFVSRAAKDIKQAPQVINRDVIAPVVHAGGNVAHAGGNVVNAVSQHNINRVANSNFNPTHLVENQIVAPAAHVAGYFGRTDIINPYRQLVAQATHNPIAYQNANRDQINTMGGSRGAAAKRLVGNTAQVALSAIPGEGALVDKLAGKAGAKVTEKLGSNVAAKAASKVVQKGTQYAGKAAVGGANGYAFGAGQVLAQDPNASLKQINQAGTQNAKFGAILGGGVPLASDVIPHTIQATHTVLQTAKNLGIKPPTNLTPAELSATNKALNGNPMDLTSQQARLFHQAQTKLVGPDLAGTAHGINAASDALNAHTAFNSHVQQRAQALQDLKAKFSNPTPLNQGGYLRNPADAIRTKLGKLNDQYKALPAGHPQRNTIANKMDKFAGQLDEADVRGLTKKIKPLDQSGHIQVRGGKESLPKPNRSSSSEPTISRPKTAPAPTTKPTLPAKPAAKAAPSKPVLPAKKEGSVASSKPTIPGSYAWLKEQEAAAEAKKAAKATSTKPKLPTAPTLPKPKKTGLVDKQLNEAQKAQRQVINYAADELRQNSATRDIHSEIRKAGGISKSDYEDIPASLKNKNGQSMDDLATQLGFKSDAELYDAIHNNSKGMTLAEAKAEAQKQLESGKHPYSGDYKQITDALKKRQDELSLYPKGTYKQVKTVTKAPHMSDAEFQSLASQPEATLPKKGNKVLASNPKTTLRNAEAERKVQDALKKGADSEEAIKTYMDATGADLQTAVKDVRRVAQESNLGFEGGKNPLTGKVPLGGHVAEGDSGQAFLNADFVRQHEQSIGKDALKAFNSLSDHDKTLLQDIEKDTVSNVAKKADNPKAFTNAEKSIRTYYDTRHAYDTALGIDVGYRQNYLRQLFAKAEDAAKADMPEQTTLKAGNKRPGYTQSRSFDTLHTHVGQALERDINGASFNHAKLTYAKDLQTAFPEQTNNSGQLVRGADGKAFRQLTNKYGEGITAHPDIAAKINNRSRTEVTNKGLQRYDKVNAGIKYTKLGGGAFHAVTEAGNFIGQQLTSGKLFTEPKATGTALKSFFSPKTMERENVRFRSSGTLQNAQIAGLKVSPHEILADADVKLGGKLSKATGIQALHDATFQREIPYMKLKMFEQKTKGLDPTKPADMAKMRSEANGINHLFGGINRDIEGINPQTFQRMQRFVLATDFTESKLVTAGRAINLTDRTPAAKLARQAVVGKVLLFAGLAAAGGALGGEYKGKSPKQIAENILGKFADPSFKMGDYKVALPATHVSELSRPFAPLFDSSKKTASDRLSGLQHYATGRLAAVPGAGFQLATNKDYSGNRIYGKDYKFNGGNQISAGKTAANVAGMFGPIPFSQVSNTVQKKQNIPAAVANVVGLRATNEKLYNQDATPVNIKVGGPSVPLSKDQSIKFNAAVATQQTAMDSQLKNTAAYKAANPTDQKTMLTTLHKQINSYQQRAFAASNNIPITKTSNAADAALASNKLPDVKAPGSSTGNSTPIAKNLDNSSKQFLTKYNAMNATDRTKAANTQNDFEYKYAQAKYQNDKANGKLTTASDIKAQDAINKAKIGAEYTKNVRDLYGLSKADLDQYLSTNDGKTDKATLGKQLIAYDKALKDAGISTSLKFKYGFGTKTGGSTAKSRRAAKFKTISLPTIKSNPYKTASTKQYKQKALPKFSKGKQATFKVANSTTALNAKLRKALS